MKKHELVGWVECSFIEMSRPLFSTRKPDVYLIYDWDNSGHFERLRIDHDFQCESCKIDLWPE